MNAKQTSMQASQASSSLLRAGILLLGLFTSIVHLIILNLDHIDPLFALNGVGYLVLLAAYFLSIPILSQNRNLVRWILMAYAALTILAYLFFALSNANNISFLGNITKLVELGFIVLLWMDRSPRKGAS
ncbi:MAG TPA: hypothetical protein VJ436_04350 [Anaerolineales bacterium]|nr:hypothetical protein [Anaerolineales bacterium]